MTAKLKPGVHSVIFFLSFMIGACQIVCYDLSWIKANAEANA